MRLTGTIRQSEPVPNRAEPSPATSPPRRRTRQAAVLAAAALAAAGVQAVGGPAPADAAPAPMQVFYGSTHNHTGSGNDHGADGSGPKQVFGAASSAGFDFLFLTEHTGPTGPGSPDAWHADARQQAEKLSEDGRFVGLVGYELSENGGDDDDDHGHMTGYGTPTVIDASSAGTGFGTFLDRVAGVPGDEAFAGFNHPPATGHPAAAEDLLTPANREVVVMSETSNRVRDDADDEAEYYDGFLAALDAGWRVAPTCGLDGHGRWAVRVRESDRKKPCRTGLLAPELTRAGVLDAVTQRRIYSTRDTNLDLRYTVNGRWMGSTLGTPRTARFDIRVEDPDTDDARDAVTRLEVVGAGGRVLAGRDVGKHVTVWRPSVRVGSNPFTFVRVFTGERSGHTAVGAPVWFE